MKHLNLIRAVSLGAAIALGLVNGTLAEGSFPGSGPQPVSRGATGRAALTPNNLIFGNGTAPVGFIAPGTSGRCLLDNGTIWTPGYCVTSAGAAATGTTGHAVPFLDGANLFSALQTVSLNAGALTSAQVGALLRLAQADGVSARLQLDSFAAPGLFSCLRADGTNASKATLSSGDEICSLNSFGYNGSAYAGPAAALRSYAAETFASGHQGAYWRFATTPNGSTTLTDRFGIEQDGGIIAPPTVTGGSMGAGTFNGTGFYVSGSQLANIFALSGSFSLPSGTLTLQPSGASTIGGVNSIAQVAHQWVQYIDTAGLPHLAQPSFPDVSGQATLAQLPTIGANTVLCSVPGGTPTACTQAQITALINLATASLSGALPAWPNNTTTFFRGDGTYAAMNFAALGGAATLAQLPSGTSDTVLGYWGSTAVSGSGVPNCTGALVYSTATHLWGCNVSAGTGTVTSAQISAGNGISVATTSGANPCTSACNLTVALKLDSQVLQASPADPIGTTSASPGVMMGLGATCHMTPTYSTRVHIEFQGFLSSTGSGVGTGVQVRYGVGGNPGNGATITGGMIALGSSPQAAANPAAYFVPFRVGGNITGLTAGTAYWFDISIYGASGTTTAKQISCDANEVM